MYAWSSATVAQGNACREQITQGTVRLSKACNGTEERLEKCGVGFTNVRSDCSCQVWIACQYGKCA